MNIAAKIPWCPPIIRWAGSKRQILGELASAVPLEFNTYYEPFAGSACLFFALKPKRAVISDLNPELISTYETIRKHPRIVHRIASSFGTGSETYYRVRALNAQHLDATEKAARFIFLNRNCFNGIYRTNRNGDFNVPFGSRTGSIPEEKRFYRVSYALRTAELRNLDFESALKDVTRGDFVYLDPPYAHSNHRDRNEYGNGSFSVADIPRLITVLRRIHSRGAQFLLSYLQVDDFINALPTKCYKKVSVTRHVSGFSGARGKVTEILIRNDDLFE